MAHGPPLLLRMRRGLRRLGESATVAPLRLLGLLLPLLPERAVLAFSDAVGFLLWALDARGRRAGMQGLEAVFGDEMPARRRRATLRGAYRNAVRSEALLFHLRDMTPDRYRRHVRISPEDDARFRSLAREHPSFVLASAHFGDWELLLASRTILDYVPPLTYLAETTGNSAVDAFFGRLRDRGSGGGALRKGGAMALRRALEGGGCVSLLADRNVPGRYGGAYVPFLGIPARTTPLPAMLAHWYGVPLAVALLIPEGRARWRLWLSGDLMEPRTGEESTDVPRALARMNDVFSRAIREHPEAWAWMLKRWKSRPTPDLGPYPAYSVLDADGDRPGSAASRGSTAGD